jgi:lipopolysaccharide export system permease protein
MKILQRYLNKTLLEMTALVFLIVAGLEVFILFLGELRDIGHGEYTLFSAFIYVVLDLPTELYMLFPMLGLLGILLGLGILANHHELMVLRVSGLSVFQINWMVIKIAIVMIVIMTLVGEWVAPRLERMADNFKIVKTSNGQMLKTIHGLWLRNQGNFLHIDAIFPKGKLAGVTMYEFDKNHRLTKSLFAQSAVYQKSHWLLKNVVESAITEQKVVTKNYLESTFPIRLNPKLLQLSKDEPEDLSLKQLRRYIRFLDENHLKDANYNFAFWSRVLQPLATLVMMLLAVPFVFGPLRSTTRGLRMLVGILFGFGFYILNQFFGPISVVYQFPPLLAAFLPTFIFGLIVLFFNRKANQI